MESLSFTSAASKAFAEAYLCFLVSATEKKMLKQLNSSESQKDTSPIIKYILFKKDKQCFA